MSTTVNSVQFKIQAYNITNLKRNQKEVAAGANAGFIILNPPIK
jgi:hypothetical protein